jgi:hypothetical protein
MRQSRGARCCPGRERSAGTTGQLGWLDHSGSFSYDHSATDPRAVGFACGRGEGSAGRGARRGPGHVDPRGPSYIYACEIITSPGGTRTAEAWLRAMFEDAPTPLRRFVVVGWVLVLRLRLGPRPSPDYVFGWKILSSTPTVVVIGVEGAMLSAQHVLRVDGSRVVHVALVRYNKLPDRALWATSVPVHVRVIPYVIGHAARSV